MGVPLDDRPFRYLIDPNTGVKNPETIPLIVVRMIYNIMSSDSVGTLEQRYIKAFKIAVDSFAQRHVIRITEGSIVLESDGIRQEVLARAKQDSLAKNIWFMERMREIQQEQERIAGNSGSA